jgi:uncharacterized protein
VSLVFVDTSALIKRYVAERGTPWVRSWIAPAAGNQVIIAEIAVTEVLATLARLRREARLSIAAFERLRDDFLAHADQEYLVNRLDDRILVLTNALVLRHPLRTLDGLHLAAALDTARVFGTSPRFVSADRQLLAVAAAEGFLTDDPNNH